MQVRTQNPPRSPRLPWAHAQDGFSLGCNIVLSINIQHQQYSRALEAVSTGLVIYITVSASGWQVLVQNVKMYWSNFMHIIIRLSLIQDKYKTSCYYSHSSAEAIHNYSTINANLTTCFFWWTGKYSWNCFAVWIKPAVATGGALSSGNNSVSAKWSMCRCISGTRQTPVSTIFFILSIMQRSSDRHWCAHLQ